MEQEKNNDTEWNIVEEQPTCEEPPSMSSFSQSIIIGSLNNRLDDISRKMDLILSKLENLDGRLQSIENSNLIKSDYDQVIFNNPDIEKILNIEDKNLNSFSENEDDDDDNVTSSENESYRRTNPISITSMNNLNSPLYNLNSNLGLKYLTNDLYKRTSKSAFTIPFSSPY